MDLLRNQSYTTKMIFRETENEDNKVSISLAVKCNHKLRMDILQSIETHLNTLFIHDYITEELYNKHKDLEKREAKLRKQNENAQKKLEEEFRKRNLELQQREEKSNLEFEKKKVKAEVEKIETKTKTKKKKEEEEEVKYIMPKL